MRCRSPARRHYGHYVSSPLRPDNVSHTELGEPHNSRNQPELSRNSLRLSRLCAAQSPSHTLPKSSTREGTP